MATTPQQFANIGLDIFTAWIQQTEELIKFAKVYEDRGGANPFNAIKHQPPEGGELTPQQIQENAEIDRLAAGALAAVAHQNDLVVWYDATRQQRANIWRTDL